MKDWNSLTPQEKKARSMKCAVFCLVVTIISLGVIFYFTKITKDRLDRCTEKTTGYIVNFYDGRFVRSWLSASFEVDGITYDTDGLYTLSDFTLEEKMNRTVAVNVWYEKGNPENAYANRPPYFDPIWFAIPGIFAIGCILFPIQAKKQK